MPAATSWAQQLGVPPCAGSAQCGGNGTCCVGFRPVPPTFPLLLTDHRPPCLHLQVVLAVGGRTLVYLELAGEGQIVEKGRLQLDSDIACLDITPVGE